MLNSSIGRLRVISIVEGISFIVLLLIAMPMKYIWGMPNAVTVVGMVHGVLFLLWCLLVFVPLLFFVAAAFDALAIKVE